MPKGIRFRELGGPEVLEFTEVTVREPGEGEARLKVEAIGLNRAESLFFRGFYMEQPNLPSGLGYEAAGVVTAVGPGVDPALVGKRLSTIPGFPMSQYPVMAEEAVVPAWVLAEVPAALSTVESAAVWMQYGTAYGALVYFGKVTRGDFVIIPAASSSVGLAAIEIARAEGATSIATTRTSAKVGELRRFGANHVIATEEEDLPARVREITGGKGARIIFDPVGGPYLETLAKAAAVEGTIFLYGLLSGQPTPFPLMEALSRGLKVEGYSLPQLQVPDRFAAMKQYIYERLADGRLKPKVDQVFRLEEAQEAYRYLESNQQIGKIVLTVG